MSTHEKIWAEVRQRTVSIFAAASSEGSFILEPRLLIEAPEAKSAYTARLLDTPVQSGPKGSITIEANQSVKLFTWSGEVDQPNIAGPSPLVVSMGNQEPGSGYDRVPATPGKYRITLFSFLNGEALSPIEVLLPPGNDTALRPEDATDDGSFVRAFLHEAKELPQEDFWMKPGRYDEKEIMEMAYLIDRTGIPSLHRELLLRCKRLQILEHDLVTPPIIADDLEEVRIHSRERDLFPWFSLKPYDRGDFICFDLEHGGLVRAHHLQIEPIAESPRLYLLKLLRKAKER
jgi:hypothetical protein